MPVRGHFIIYLGLGIYGHGVCVCTLFMNSRFDILRARGQVSAVQRAPPLDYILEGLSLSFEQHNLEIVRLGIPRLGTWRKRKQGFYENVIWPPMALMIGLLGSSAPQNDGLDAPVILQC